MFLHTGFTQTMRGVPDSFIHRLFRVSWTFLSGESSQASAQLAHAVTQLLLLFSRLASSPGTGAGGNARSTLKKKKNTLFLFVYEEGGVSFPGERLSGREFREGRREKQTALLFGSSSGG